MADPSSTLRQMILFDATFDLIRVRTLCLQITAGMYDTAQATQLHQDLVDELGRLREELALAEALDLAHGGLRLPALDALDRMVKTALG